MSIGLKLTLRFDFVRFWLECIWHQSVLLSFR